MLVLSILNLKLVAMYKVGTKLNWKEGRHNTPMEVQPTESTPKFKKKSPNKAEIWDN